MIWRRLWRKFYTNSNMESIDKIRLVISKIMRMEFIRFAMVGVFATIIHYGIYYILLNLINVNIAYTIGYLISFCCNFWLSAKFTFKADPTTKRGLGFAISHLINYVLQMLVLNVSIKMGIPEPFAPIPVYAICIPVNFLLVRFVFKKI